jgi:hypothetical protein
VVDSDPGDGQIIRTEEMGSGEHQVVTGQLGGVYEAIAKWISDNGLTVARAPRETY